MGQLKTKTRQDKETSVSLRDDGVLQVALYYGLSTMQVVVEW